MEGIETTFRIAQADLLPFYWIYLVERFFPANGKFGPGVDIWEAIAMSGFSHG